MEKIKTSSGGYEYEPTALYYGRKIIDKSIASENLLLLKSVLDKDGVFFGLIYGTLLGAYRDNDFISHDEDADIYILDEDRIKVIDLLFFLREKGFEVARYENDLLSVIRKNDYIDIYIFKKSFGGRKCNGDFLPNRFFKKTSKIEFLGCIFNAPGTVEDFLEFAYGKTWKTPIKNKPAEVKSFSSKIKSLLRKILPGFIIKLLKIILGKK
ncbi:hypothetical protein J3998_02075 [Thiomicrorhabdus sp. 6S2-11]|uniref:LicD family protein n=1 Tax=Thiomicrorhabdus marina TaxID=2818442 RepID=A0ABS3Q1Z9_9GAMM|nr:hypothetical protein [Thiomicrorhabdus marina]MBO1926352.1 hypothetical protein [Thiomicrorhabdus marina]